MSIITGSHLTIKQAEEEYEANFFATAKKVCGKEKQLAKLSARLLSMLNRLASGDKLRSPDRWNTEGILPNGKNYYAIKPHRKLRAYGWYSSKHKSVFYISHFAFKKSKKLSNEDHSRVTNNWKRIEE